MDPDTAAPAGHSPTGEKDEPRYLNREISWLEFNSRVLAIAEDPERPPLERAKFLAIASTNLDEFFQIRVAGLKEQVRMGLQGTAIDGMTAQEQLLAIREHVESQVTRQGEVFTKALIRRLEDEGIAFSGSADLDERSLEYLGTYFHERVFPVLTPLAVDPAHPFPYISNLSLNLAVMVRDPGSGVRRFARVKVPPLLPRFVALPDGRFVPLEQVIALHLPTLFPGMETVAHYPFRVTRNADIEVAEDEAADLLSALEEELRRRRRSARVVRLEVESEMSDQVRDLLVRELELAATDVYEVDGLLDAGALWALYDLDRPDLKDPPWKPTTQPRLASSEDTVPDLFAVVRERDVLVHHPYDSFATSTEAFIAQAASDPAVLAIKQTLYRTSGQESPIIRALIEAAAAGKQVVALVELKARFDEQANIAWARALEEAGVHVVYGVVGLKTHAKLSLVVRQEGGGIRRYAHIGTGNYDPTTATIYEDAALLTTDQELGADLSDLFNYLTGYSRKARYRRLLVAPLTLREAVIDLIRGQAEQPGGHIVMKEQPGGRRGDRRPVRGLPAGDGHRPRRPQHLLPPARRPGPVGADPGGVHRGPVPRARPHPSVRQGPGAQGLLHRLGRPHAQEPGPPGGDAHPGDRAFATGTARRDPGGQPPGRPAGLGAVVRRLVDPGSQDPDRQHPPAAPGPGHGQDAGHGCVKRR